MPEVSPGIYIKVGEMVKLETVYWSELNTFGFYGGSYQISNA